jgi:glycosyltransferase involved in cell wall biosynthesis
MNKPNIVISCPIDTYSGYGARARDFVKALIELDKFDVKILPQRWGETRWGYLKDHNDTLFTPRLVNQLTQQPDVWVQISIPNEFQKIGKYNIGVTAGIETTLCDPSWIKGANNMDLLLVSSKHAVESFERSKFDLKNEQTGQITEKIELTTKVEVLFEGADVTKYFPTTVENKSNVSTVLDSIPESFCFLTTGHWMQGDFGEDRKNIGFTIKSFLETFKNKANAPALIMKSHSVTTSIMDRERMLDKINEVRKTVKGTLPNIYLIHGEVSDSEMNELYNHHKVKALVSLTKGEGFGRPFLEFSLVNKPIIASSWSAQTDFLDREFVRFVKGDLTPIHRSALVKNIILEQAHWFSPDPVDVGKAYKEVYKDYKNWMIKAKRQGHKSRTQFSYDKMVETLKTIVDTNIPEFPKQIGLTLPKLELPKLKKL